MKRQKPLVHQMKIPSYIKFFYIVLFLFLASCKTEREQVLYEEALTNIKKNEIQEAIKNLDLILITKPESPFAMKAVHLGAEITDEKLEYKTNFIKFAKFLILNSENEKEQIEFQKRIANTYFENGEYNNAVTELQRVLSKPGEIEDRYELLLLLAKSYYFLRNFEQSRVEIKKVVQESPIAETRVQAEILTANIFSTLKKYKEALEIYKKLKNTQSELYKKNDLDLSVALLYEEIEDFDTAINILKSMDSTKLGKQFLKDKIERLELRKSLLPGAKGLIK